MGRSASVESQWVFNPAVDLLLGCGVGWALLATGAALAPVERDTLLRWGVLATFVTGMPHYGATLLRVYDDPAERRKYAFFTLWASLAIWAWFVLGVHAPLAGSLLVTLYVTWSPWHYAGQNYGLGILFLRRRAITLETPVKRALYASFLLSYALTFLTLHGGYEAAGYVPLDVTGTAYRVLGLGIPRPVYELLFPAVLAAHLIALGFAFTRLLRGSTLSRLLPLLLLAGTQAVWFTIPAVALWISGARIQDEHVVFFFLWAGIAHAVQYLWITTYYAARSTGAAGRLGYLAKTLLAGGLVFALPALIFAPGLAGTVPFDTGLWLLVASAVNVQHFVLDGAIWKLRDGPVARVLLARPLADEAAGAARVTPVGAWARRAIWSLAAVCTALAIGAALEFELGWAAARSRGDHARAELAERRLAAIGRDNPLFYQRRAEAEVARGNPRGAIAEYERSIALYPTADAWYALGIQRASLGDHAGALAAFQSSLEVAPTAEAWTGLGAVQEMNGAGESAAASFERALELNGSYVPALHLAARYWLGRGEAERARDLLQRALALAPDDEQVRADLRRAGG